MFDNWRRWAVLGAVAVASVGLGIAMSGSARGQTVRSAVCTSEFPVQGLATVKGLSAGAQTWMNEQLGAGKTEFVSVPLTANYAALCAW